MPLVVDGTNNYTAKEAAEYLGIARDTFYRNVRNGLPTYHCGAFKRESLFVKLISTGTKVFIRLKKTNRNSQISMLNAEWQ